MFGLHNKTSTHGLLLLCDEDRLQMQKEKIRDLCTCLRILILFAASMPSNSVRTVSHVCPYPTLTRRAC